MNKFRLILVALLFMIAATGFGQNQTSTLTIENEVSTANTYTFDVFLTNTGTGTLEIANFSTRVNFNPAIRNGGTITPTIMASDVPGWVTQINAKYPATFKVVVGATIATNYVIVPALANSGFGSGFTIPSGERRLMYTVKLTNTVNWTASSLANCALSTTNPATKLSQYNATTGVATSTTAPTLMSTLLNAPLNNVPSVPIAQTVTGGGSYCAGTTPTGVSVGLASSEVGYDYDLYKDGAIVAGSTIAGTGLELAWTNLGIGLYTVKSGTTDMTGNAVVTVTPVAIQPTVSVVNNCDGTSTLAIDLATLVVGANPVFVWSGGIGSSNASVNVGFGTYTVTQSADGVCTSLPSADAYAAPKQKPATPTIDEMPNCGNSEFSLQNLAVGATVKWYDGVNLVHTGDIYTVYTNVTNLTATQEIAGCVSAASIVVSSNIIPSVTPAVSIVADANNVCAGTSVTFTPTPVNGGTTPTYEWFVGAVSQGTSATFAYVPVDGNAVSCVMTSNDGCASPLTATSNAVNMIVNPILPVSVSIAADASTVCAGTTVTFTATPENGGTPTYQWKVNGNPVGAGLATYAYAPANNDEVTCVMTSSLTGCISGNPATSNAVNMIVNPILPVSVSIAADASTVCAGTTVTFTATPENGGTPTYQWKVNGNPVGAGLATYAYAPANNDEVTCVMTSSLTGCISGNPATSNAVNMIVNPILPVSVSIAADASTVCAGTTVTFTATPENGGTPTYQWKVNGTDVGTGSTTYAYAPANNDEVTCVMTSTLTGCISGNPATSNAVNMTINTPATQIVTIAANQPNPVNQYIAVTYTATAVPASANQTFVWKLNGQVQVNFTSNYFVNTLPIDGDVISCTANANGCFTGGVAATYTQNVTTVILTTTWTGAANNNLWSDAANWDLAVPTVGHDAIIPVMPASNYPVISTAVCHNLTLMSNATGTAQLINNGTLTIGGKVYANQYLSAGQWHFVSSPINNATAYAYSNANPNNASQNLFLQTYNEGWVNNPGTSPWSDVIDGPGTIMSAGKGFEAWSANNHVITMEGTQLNSANVVAPVAYTGGASYPGFNLIGNPYPSAINILSFPTWGNNMDASMWIWDGSQYFPTNGVIGAFDTVAACQSFMVKANAGASFTIPAAARTFGGTFLKSTVSDVLKLKVSGNGYNDAAYINFNSSATANYDGQFDVEKIFGIDAAPQFYSTITNKNLSINTLPSLTSPVVVPMSLNVGANTTYTITASEMNSFANGTTITLEDTKTNTFTNLMQQAVYTFTANPADNANRFKVHFGVNGINENANGNISIYSNSNVIYVNNNSNEVVKEIVVMNVLGQEILNKKAANTTINTITMDVASAYYVVKVVTASKVYTEKVYVK